MLRINKNTPVVDNDILAEDFFQSAFEELEKNLVDKLSKNIDAEIVKNISKRFAVSNH
jgi:hypothetical protein